MPIKIPNDLPARLTLEKEGVMILTEDTASRQDIRPLRIGLLNLMPDKIRTETQFARLIGATPLQVELSLIKITNHTSKNTPNDHMIAFYRDWEKLRNEKFDGLIITGAPIELLEFEDVTYWDELKRIYDWTQSHVHSTFNICWGAQAALYHFHHVPKHALAKKAFGIYRHKNLSPASPYLRGFSDDFSMPVSRWTENLKSELPKGKGLEVLMESEDSGLCFVADDPHRQLYMFNHIEYDTNTLGDEYRRDMAAGKATEKPANYFPGGNAAAMPENRWRSHAHLLFGNWINEVYQTTPYALDDIGKI
ncbi:MAG: homoserine O-succinyltransferase [Aestuariivirga sp.]